MYRKIEEMVGNTPLVRYRIPDKPEVGLYVKLEGANPTGSVKDRVAWALVNDAVVNKKITPEKELIATTSGNFGSGVVYYGYLAGLKSTIITGRTLTEDKKFFMEFFGANLISQKGRTFNGHELIINEILPKAPDKYYYLDQLHDPVNPKTHYETTGPEIYRDMPEVEAVAFSLGSGATLMGVGQFLKEKNPNIKMIAAIGGTGTRIPGTGDYAGGEYKTPFYYKIYENGWVDKTYAATTEQANLRIQQLREQGFFVGIQTGAVLEAAIRGIEEMEIKGRVVMISGDAGWKNVEKLRGL